MDLCNAFIDGKRYGIDDSRLFWKDVQVHLVSLPVIGDKRCDSLYFAVNTILNTKSQMDEETIANIFSLLQEALSTEHDDELDTRLCNILRRFFDQYPSTSIESTKSLVENIQHRVHSTEFECNKSEKLDDLIYVATGVFQRLSDWDQSWENLVLAILEKQILAIKLNLPVLEKNVFSSSFPNFFITYLQFSNNDTIPFAKMNDLLTRCVKLIKHTLYQTWNEPVLEFVKSVIQMETTFAGEKGKHK